MRNFICIIGCILLLGNAACKDNHKQELALKEKELALKQQELELQEREARLQKSSSRTTERANETENSVPEQRNIPKTVTKYMYVFITTDEPELHRIEEIELPSRIPGYYDDRVPKYRVYATSEFYNYTSEIITVSDYNEDKRYMEIEKFEKEVNRRLRDVNANLQTEERLMLADEPSNANATIISRNSFVFDTYREASEHKRKK